MAFSQAPQSPLQAPYVMNNRNMRIDCSRSITGALFILSFLTEIMAANSASLGGGARFRIDVWESDDGLPQNSVISMIQSEDGYLWLGTLYGLARFDGIRFTVYDESTTPGLSSSPIVTLFEDRRRNLWIGTESSGIVLVQEGAVLRPDFGRNERDRRVAAVCEDSAGAVWLLSADGRLARFSDGVVRIWSAREVKVGSARSIVSDRSGLLRIGTSDGLFTLDPDADLESSALPLTQTHAFDKLDYLLASESGGYWLLADGHVQKWSADSMELDFGLYPWGNTVVSAACEDRQGNLLVGTQGGGVYWYNSDGMATHISKSQGLSYDYILSLHVDREGNLWVGTDGGGLNRVKREEFESLSQSQDLVIQSVDADAQGAIWMGVNRIGSDARGAARWKDGELKWFGPREGLLSSAVRSVFVDRRQQVWAGTWGAGLFQFQDERFRRVTLPKGIDPKIQAIHQDRSGMLWVGTQAGLARWNGEEWQVIAFENGFPKAPVRAIADDADGNVWIGTSGAGLIRIGSGKMTEYHVTDGLPSEEVSSLYVDEENVLWAGTIGSGLARFQNGAWTRFTTREGLASNIVLYLVEDLDGYFWIGSNAGLMRIEKRVLNDFAKGLTAFTPCRVYTRLDGMPASECIGFQPGACLAPDGRLWFPTIKGLVTVDPRALGSNAQPPPVVIESVLIDGLSQNANGLRAKWLEALVVPASRERIEIHYTSLNLSAPELSRFKYRLEGHEAAWTEAGSTRIARYSKLPAGDYRFQVTASNEDGVWNEGGTSLGITIVPPFWRAWWFLSAGSLFCLGVTVGTVHFVSTQRLQRQVEKLRQKEAIERERARIARDIHDQLGASLTQVALLGELVESDKDLPEEVEAHARQISQTARDTTKVLDEIVWTVNPSNDTLDGLINYVCKYVQEYLEVAGIRFRLETPSHLPEVTISPEVRHNVFLASKEAVTNVVRHAHANSVRVQLSVQPRCFTLGIQDDGKALPGLDEDAARSRNGLRNMRKRMEDVGGSFAFEPVASGGTLVRLTVPIGSESGFESGKPR